jgi:hypothetical protein
MQQANQGLPVEQFPNVVPLEKIAPAHPVSVDVPDTAPPADIAEQGLHPSVAPDPDASAKPKPAPAAPHRY